MRWGWRKAGLPFIDKLTYWDRDKMAPIFKMTFSITISLNLDHAGTIHNIIIIGSDNGFLPTRRQAIIWNNNSLTIYTFMRHSALITSIQLGHGQAITFTQSFIWEPINRPVLNSSDVYLNYNWSFEMGDWFHPSVLREYNYLSMPWSRCWFREYLLTHWDRDKMDAISQTTFSTAFPW